MSSKVRLFLFFIFASLCQTTCSDEEESIFKTYRDVKFEDLSMGTDAKLYFSTTSGKSYGRNDLDDLNKKHIDVGFVQRADDLYEFITPNAFVFSQDALKTIFINDSKNHGVTVEMFDRANNLADFSEIDFSKSDERSFDDNHPNIIVFKNAAGKIGLIKTKSTTRQQKPGSPPYQYITVDIKIQK